MHDLEQDFNTFGSPPAEFLAAAQESESFELWPENEAPLMLFMRMRTQWRMGPAGPVGLDYAGVRAALALMRERCAPERFDDLQAMEAAALEAMHREH